MNIPWILVSIAGGIIIVAVLFFVVYKRRRLEREVDYRNYFSMGIIWLPVGIVFYLVFESLIGAWFFIMGLVYLAIGLKNKDKWGTPQKVSPKYQKILMMAVVIGVIILVLGILVFEIILY